MAEESEYLTQEARIVAQAEAAARVINAFANQIDNEVIGIEVASPLIEAFGKALFMGNFVGRQFSCPGPELYGIPDINAGGE